MSATGTSKSRTRRASSTSNLFALPNYKGDSQGRLPPPSPEATQAPAAGTAPTTSARSIRQDDSRSASKAKLASHSAVIASDEDIEGSTSSDSEKSRAAALAPAPGASTSAFAVGSRSRHSHAAAPASSVGKSHGSKSGVDHKAATSTAHYTAGSPPASERERSHSPSSSAGGKSARRKADPRSAHYGEDNHLDSVSAHEEDESPASSDDDLPTVVFGRMQVRPTIATAAAGSGGAASRTPLSHHEIQVHVALLKNTKSLLIASDAHATDAGVAMHITQLKKLVEDYSSTRLGDVHASALLQTAWQSLSEMPRQRIMGIVFGRTLARMPDISLSDFADRAFAAYAHHRPSLLTRLQGTNPIHFVASREQNYGNIQGLRMHLEILATETAPVYESDNFLLTTAALQLLPSVTRKFLDEVTQKQIREARDYMDVIKLIEAFCKCTSIVKDEARYGATDHLDVEFPFKTLKAKILVNLSHWRFDRSLILACGSITTPPDPTMPWYTPAKPGASSTAVSTALSHGRESVTSSLQQRPSRSSRGQDRAGRDRKHHQSSDAAPAITASGAPAVAPSAPRARCRDFDNHGECTRGTACPYKHATHNTVCKFLGDPTHDAPNCLYRHPRSGLAADPASSKPPTRADWKSRRPAQAPAAAATTSTGSGIPTVKVAACSISLAAIFPSTPITAMGGKPTLTAYPQDSVDSDDGDRDCRVWLKVGNASILGGLDTFADIAIIQRHALTAILDQISPEQRNIYGIRSLGTRSVNVQRPCSKSVLSEAEFWQLPFQVFGSHTASDGAGLSRPYEWGCMENTVMVDDHAESTDFSHPLLLPAAKMPFKHLFDGVFKPGWKFQSATYPYIPASGTITGIQPLYALTQLQLLPPPLPLPDGAPLSMHMPEVLERAIEDDRTEAKPIRAFILDDLFASDEDDDKSTFGRKNRARPESKPLISSAASTTAATMTPTFPSVSVGAASANSSPFAEFALTPEQLGIQPELVESPPTEEQLLSTVAWQNLHPQVVLEFRPIYLKAISAFCSLQPIPGAEPIEVDIKLRDDAVSSIAHQPTFAPRLQTALRNVLADMRAKGTVRSVPQDEIDIQPDPSRVLPRFNLMIFAGQKPGNPDAVRLLLNAVPVNANTERRVISGQKSDNLAAVNKLTGASIFSVGDCADAFASMKAGKTLRWCARFTFERKMHEYTTLPQGVMEGAIYCDHSIGICVYDCEVPLSTVRSQLADDFAIGTKEDIALPPSVRIIQRDRDHMTALVSVLLSLCRRAFRGRWQKCRFATLKTDFAGFETDGRTVRNSPSRVQHLRDLACPSSAKQLRSHIHLFLYYARLSTELPKLIDELSDYSLKHCGVPVKGLPDSLRKVHRRCCTLLADNMPVAAIDRSRPVHIRPDASRLAIAGSIGQYDNTGTFVPIAHSHRRLTPTERNWEVVSIEMLAVTHTVLSNKHLLEYPEAKLVAESDHQDLCYTNRISTPRVQSMLLLLSTFSITFTHLPGCNQIVADALSRSEVVDTMLTTTTLGALQIDFSPSEIFLFNTIAPDIDSSQYTVGAINTRRGAAQALRTSLAATLLPTSPAHAEPVVTSPTVESPTTSASTVDVDTTVTDDRFPVGTSPITAQIVLAQLALPDSERSSWLKAAHVTERRFGSTTMLLRKGRLLIPDSMMELRKRLIKMAHDSIGHGGRDDVLYRLKHGAKIHWRGIDAEVSAYVRSCVPCQHAKAGISPSHGGAMTQYLYLYPFHTVLIDFVGPLPVAYCADPRDPTGTHHAFSYIITIVDAASRKVSLIASVDKSSAAHRTLWLQDIDPATMAKAKRPLTVP